MYTINLKKFFFSFFFILLLEVSCQPSQAVKFQLVDFQDDDYKGVAVISLLEHRGEEEEARYEELGKTPLGPKETTFSLVDDKHMKKIRDSMKKVGSNLSSQIIFTIRFDNIGKTYRTSLPYFTLDRYFGKKRGQLKSPLKKPSSSERLKAYREVFNNISVTCTAYYGKDKKIASIDIQHKYSDGYTLASSLTKSAGSSSSASTKSNKDNEEKKESDQDVDSYVVVNYDIFGDGETVDDSLYMESLTDDSPKEDLKALKAQNSSSSSSSK
jgi:hypothetical protein